MGIYQKNGNWYVDYYADHRRKREMVGPNKRLAEQVLAKRKVQILEGKYFDVARDEKIKFRDFANVYYENHSKVNKKSGWCDEYRIERLNTYFGDKYLNQITSLDIEKFKADRVKGAAPATVNRELALIKGIFTKAIQWEKFHRQNPAKLVKNFRENNVRLRYLSKEEITRLYEHCDGELLALVKVALNTGMRRGEILALTWNDVDIKRRLIYIRDSKSGKSRVIPMNETVRGVLLGLKKLKDSSQIFSGRHRELFERVLKRANIEDASFHTLRHTAASWLVMSGVDLLTVSRILGHSDVKMTMRYAHLSSDHIAGAVQRLDTIWTPRRVSENPIKPQLVETEDDAEVAKLADAQDLKS